MISGRVLGDQRVGADDRVRRHRTDHDRVAVLADPAQGLDPAEVDDDLRGVEPHPQHRQQALSAGQDLGVVPVLAPARSAPPRPRWERGSRTVRGSCARSFRAVAWPGSDSSKCGIAAPSVAPPAPGPLIALHTRSGVHGIRMSLTPRWRTASTTAFTTAGVEAIVPASPTPLVPSVFVVARRGRVVDVEADRVGRGRQQVVDEGAGDQRAGVVVHRLLPERLGDALHQAAVHLAGDDQRVDDVADVVDADVLAHLQRRRSRCRPPSRTGGCRAGS